MRLGQQSQGEMLAEWERHIRTYEFCRDERPPLTPELPRARPTRPATTKPGDGRRDRWIVITPGPGPGACPRLPLPSPGFPVPFALQSGRGHREPLAGPAIRDTGPGIDAVRPQFPRPVPFRGQSGRERSAACAESLWEELGAEQQQMVSIIASSRPQSAGASGASQSGAESSHASAPARPRTAGFGLQRGRPPHPFAHCMGDSVLPAAGDYDTARPEPVRAFDIAQPGLGSRSDLWLLHTGGPDKMYDSQGGFAATTPRPQSAPLISRSSAERDSFVLHPEGRGEPLLPPSTLSSGSVIDLGRLAPRVISLESKR